ncbi:MAG: 3,4-dihydroxy-2-butanone-4-phosphate synthase [Chlorobi bacterium]|nr:3,4-dihydroxy-2-butanone-4-phosphate synthase [Chlorobiota bacterium]
MTRKNTLDKVEDAIRDIREGKMVIVVDDENRENEGDFVAAAEKVTPEMINFMATHGRGLICAPITEERADELDLPLMVDRSADPLGTAFTVSVDLISDKTTTGISAADRAETIRALTDENVKAHQLRRPGHVFPLRAKDGGVLRRPGHTEAAIDLARLAGLKPAGVIVEIMNEDGSMARLPQLKEIARKHGLKIISIEDLIRYRLEKDSLIKKIEKFPVSTRFGDFTLHVYEQTNKRHLHFALTSGRWSEDDIVPVRVEGITHLFDMLNFLKESPDDRLRKYFDYIKTHGKGALIFVYNSRNWQELVARIKQYAENIRRGKDELPPLKPDDKDYGIGAQIIHDLGIRKINYLTRAKASEEKTAVKGFDIEIVKTTPLG